MSNYLRFIVWLINLYVIQKKYKQNKSKKTKKNAKTKDKIGPTTC